MKNLVKARLGMLAGAVLMLTALFASPAAAKPFQVKTSAATNIGAYGANLYGAYYAQQEGGIALFQYGTSESFGQETTPQSISPSGFSQWITVGQRIEDLQPETTYYYRFGTLSSNGEVSLGQTFSFTTRSLPRLEADRYLAKVTAQQDASNPMSIGLEGGDFTCQQFGGSGTMLAATSALKLTPTFSNCKILGFLSSIVIATNGCTEVIRPSDPNHPSGSLDIVCPEGQSINVQAATCKFSIPPQSGLRTVEAINNPGTSPPTVSLSYEVSGLTYVKTQDGFGCPFNGLGTRNNGTISGGQMLTAVDSSNAPNGLKIGY